MAGNDDRLVRLWTKAIEAIRPPSDVTRARRVDQAITDDGQVRLDRAYGPLRPENAGLLDSVSVAVVAPDGLSSATNLEDRLVEHGDEIAAVDTILDALVAIPFITQTPSTTLTGEQALSALPTGGLAVTTATGVVRALAAGDLPSGIDAAKIADGSVSNAEFERLDGVTADIQTQLDGKVNDTGDTITGPLSVEHDLAVASGGLFRFFVDTDGSNPAVLYLPNGTTLIFQAGNFTGDTTAIDGATGGITTGGTFQHTGAAAGFFNAGAIAKPTISGSRGGNAALASLLTALANLGLITDSSSA